MQPDAVIVDSSAYCQGHNHKESKGNGEGSIIPVTKGHLAYFRSSWEILVISLDSQKDIYCCLEFKVKRL